MKTATFSIAVLLLVAAVARGGSDDPCRKELDVLRQREKGRCSGLGYLLDPSGCIAARKALAAAEKEGCRDNAPPAAVVSPAPPAPAAPEALAPAKKIEEITSMAPASPEPGLAELKRENQRLREENSELREELRQLRSRIYH